jgi:hypothetical protein
MNGCKVFLIEESIFEKDVIVSFRGWI